MERDIREIGRLARLAMTDQEAAEYDAQLERILDYVATLNELDTSDVEPTTHVVPDEGPLRADEAQTSLSPEIALKNAPEQDEGSFVVPRVV